MKESVICAVLKRIGTRPLERLEWAVDFSQRPLATREDRAKVELELTCFLWTEHMMRLPKPIDQIKALMTHAVWKHIPYRGQEVISAQQCFTQVLNAAAGDGTVRLRLKYVTAQFTRADGVGYTHSVPGRRLDGQSIVEQTEERKEAKLEIIVFRLLQLLDQTVRTGAKDSARFIPLRLYVGICPAVEDGCGKLFARSRIRQGYCSRTCVSRAQVRRFRRKHAAKEQKKGAKSLR